jgi:hypothetical protein
MILIKLNNVEERCRRRPLILLLKEIFEYLKNDNPRGIYKALSPLPTTGIDYINLVRFTPLFSIISSDQRQI